MIELDLTLAPIPFSRNFRLRIQYQRHSCEPHKPLKANRTSFMEATLRYLLAQMLANAIFFTGIVFGVFALTGQWPPRRWLVATSIGGSFSPLSWKLVAAIFLSDYAIELSSFLRQKRAFG